MAILNTKPRRTSYLAGGALLALLFLFIYTSTPSQPRVPWPRIRSTTPQQKPLQDTSTDTSTDTLTATDPTTTSGFNELIYSFQNDLTQYRQPAGLSSLSTLAPKFLNPKSKSHGPTFATYLSTRNSSIHDPYFLATEHLVYRTLWKPTTHTRTGYPFTVFVAPFIPQQQRDLLAGAGANVVELPLIPWEPTVEIFARWRDLFSKLHMWAQTQFSLIAFLDSDAFPLAPLDDIFAVAQPQHCRRDLLTHPDDKKREKEICDYVFAGCRMMYIEEINVGVTVFSPNHAMHARLVRESADPNNFDNSMAEQAFLNKYFGKASAFPTQFIPREWNGFWASNEEEGKLKVIHEKLWAFSGNAEWASDIFEVTHREMVEFYEGEEFKRRRKSEAGKAMKDLEGG